MMKYTEKNKRQGRTRRLTLTARGAGLLPAAPFVFTVLVVLPIVPLR